VTNHWKNKLYFGDNIGVVRAYIEGESIGATNLQ